MADKLRVGVIFGGRSGEHQISLLSARSVIDAMDAAKYEIVPIAISQEGQWLAIGDARKALEQGIANTPATRAALLAEPNDQRLVPLDALASTKVANGNRPGTAIDVIFPVLHGTFGEDGTVQGLLELAGIPYVGAGVAGSAVGMDKVLMKSIFAAHGFPQVPYVAVLRTEWERDARQVEERIEHDIGWPCFVKPANLGSSVGVSKAHNRAELGKAIDEAARYDRKIIVEKGVPNTRELECAVLGNDQPEASVVGEIVAANEFYDYEAKYVKDDSKLFIPADIPKGLAERIRDLSKRAFLALDGSGLSRVDFLLNGKTNELFLNEVNTMPGFTRISMYPKLWEASGVPYPRLIDRLIELALERHREKARNVYSFQR
jgi:D-alanine-D-alanine ligase